MAENAATKACGDVHLSLLQVEPHGAPRLIILCLFRHAIILSIRRGLAGIRFFLQMRESSAIPVRGSECGANGSSASSGAYSAARDEL